MSENKTLIAAGVGLAALAAVVAFQAFTGDDETGQPEPDPVSPSATVTLEPGENVEPSPGEPDATDEAEVEESGPPEAAMKVASDAVVAYTQHSWRDADEHAWRGRLAPYVTDGFEHELEEMFGADDPYWERTVVPEQREVRSEVVRVDESGMHADVNSKRKVTLTVAYVASTKTKDTDWGEGDEMTLWVDVVKRGSGWKVSSIRSAGEGGY